MKLLSIKKLYKIKFIYAGILLALTAAAHAQDVVEPVELPTEYVNVADYTGTVNEQISAAIAAASATEHKTVFFPNGIYPIRHTVSLNQGPTTEVHLVGESREGVFIISDVPYLKTNYNDGNYKNGGKRLTHMINLL
jgi:opacity protein-like surface antigen